MKNLKLHPENTLKEMRTAFGVSSASVLCQITQLGITYEKIILYKERDQESAQHSQNSLAKNRERNLFLMMIPVEIMETSRNMPGRQKE
jgi:hypothetical protein